MFIGFIDQDCLKADGTHAAEATTIELDVPDFEAFTGPDNFGRLFNEYEHNALKVRNEVVAAATQKKYLHELAKNAKISKNKNMWLKDQAITE